MMTIALAARRRHPVTVGIAALCLLALLAGCGSGVQKEASYPSDRNRGTGNRDAYADPGERSSVFGGEGGINIFGGGNRRNAEAEAGGGTGVGVNSYLWRASLDTLSFMPLSSADPFGGVIITDWFTPPETPQERFKMNVYILDRQLRADGVRVSVFRQRQTTNGWVDAQVAEGTDADIENKILTRARELRVVSQAQ